MLNWKKGNNLATTSFTVYGLMWIALFFLYAFNDAWPDVNPEDIETTVGMFFIV